MKCWDIALLQQLGILDERYEGRALYCLRQRHRAVLAAVRDVARGQDQGRLAGKCRRLNRHRKGKVTMANVAQCAGSHHADSAARRQFMCMRRCM